jgi:L-threonylcarbamoyladenylate synthase
MPAMHHPAFNILKVQITKAVKSLRMGDVIAFPTETVYGLGADISRPEAIRKIFEVKGRPYNHPLIVHFSELAELDFWAKDIPDTALILAKHFWPGPLTLILPKSEHVPLSVTGGQNTVGLRIPRHPIALQLLKELGNHRAIAAPSANRFGFVSPTTADHVKEEFGDSINIILDGGSCEVGLESTIVSCIDKEVTILRPGGISISLIENILKQKVMTQPHNHAIRASGSLASHYATTTPLETCRSESLLARILSSQRQGIRTAVIIWNTHEELIQPESNDKLYYVFMPNDPIKFAKNLYAILHELDSKNFQQILVEAPPDNLEWLAIADRLTRASSSYSFHK